MKRFMIYLYALLRSAYIFTIGYVFHKNRRFISNIAEILGYPEFKKRLDADLKTIIPEIEISSIVDDAAPVCLCEVPWVDGNISLIELTAIVKLVRQYKPTNIFEIGTFDGRTTLNMTRNSPESAIVYTLDLPKDKKKTPDSPKFAGDTSFVDKAVTGSRFCRADCRGKISQLFGDSATFDFSPYYNKIDFVFIDGAHTYNYILNDSEKALKLLRNGRGIILWHDYSWVWPDAIKALNKLYKSGNRLGSIRHIKGTSLVCYIYE